MRFTHLFVDRPVFAAVLSILIVLFGAAAFRTLPVAQYPEIAPPTIEIRASYPGASAETVSETVSTPLEEQINGVENMLYMTSQATGDGQLSLQVTFALGTDLDFAQVLVQNRVAIAEPRLPEAVRRLGVTVQKSSPDLMMVIHMLSPDGSRDSTYISNYARLQVQDVLARLDGIGQVRVFGAREYSMRLWLDPDRAAARDLTADDIVQAVRGQNVQVAGGVLNQPPLPQQGAFQQNVETEGRLETEGQFEQIIVKTDGDGRVTRLADVARVELGAQDYGQIGLLNNGPAVPMLIFQRPGSNALDTADAIRTTMDRLSAEFPEGLEHRIVYNPTDFIAQSVDAVYQTIFEAAVLVILVIILFLQSWRASIIPILAIPVSLIGTFAVMAGLGYSINTLTLFGMVLAIGIVVDDAIVVVENIERNMSRGMAPRAAAHATMDEVGGALIATSLVLIAVFVPAAFIAGIQGQFFRQFAVTIAVATAFSTLVSLTLSPALAALLLKPHQEGARPPAWLRPVAGLFSGFNWMFDRVTRGYGALTARLVRMGVVVLVVYGGLIALTGWQFQQTPTGFIPQQDLGYTITVVQLPPGASLARTEAVVRRAGDLLREVDGVANVVQFAGFDGATFTNASNAGAIFSPLLPFEERVPAGRDVQSIIGDMNATLSQIQEAFIITIQPPPVRGIGNAGGFKMMIQDRRGRGTALLEQTVNEMIAAAQQDPRVVGTFTQFNTRTPRIFADIDRVRAEMLGVPVSGVFDALEVYLGSAFVNDFTFLNRTFRVTAQADAPFRQNIEALADYRMRNLAGEMVPFGAVAAFEDRTGPYRVPRYNLYPAAELQGSAAPGVSSGEALLAMEQIADRVLPAGFGYEWTELALQEKLNEGSTLLVFVASAVLVFLVLAALYESWLLPLAVVLIVPMCLLAAVSGLMLRGLDINILAQIGFVVLIGLAAKNAILIVEFARQLEREGRSRIDAAVEAATLRLRPIVMTSLAFVLGVLPLVLATGAGAEMRQSLGTAVFYGMIGVTVFGLLFTPVFYALCRWLSRDGRGSEPDPEAGPASADG